MESPRLSPLIIDAPQRSPEWFKARLGKVTGSKASATMSYAAPTKAQMAQAMAIYQEFEIDIEYIAEMSSKYPWKFVLDVGIDLEELAERKNYRQAIVGERLTGMQADPDQYINYAMKWGIVCEPLARALYQLKSRSIVAEAPLMLHPKWECGASPDGLVIDTLTGLLGNVEIKCLTTANHLYKIIRDQQVPAEYIPQIQMQMWINGRDFCDFIGYDSRLPEGLEIFIKRVERDNFYIDNILVPSIKRFLDECEIEFKYFWAEATEKGRASAKLVSPEFAM